METSRIPPDRPLPLEMPEPDAERVSKYIAQLLHESEPNQPRRRD